MAKTTKNTDTTELNTEKLNTEKNISKKDNTNNDKAIPKTDNTNTINDNKETDNKKNTPETKASPKTDEKANTNEPPKVEDKNDTTTKASKKEKISKEKLLKRKLLKQKQYQDIYEIDKELTLRRKIEEINIKKDRKKAIILLATIICFPVGLYKLLKYIRKKKLLENPFELRKIIIIEEAYKKHKEKNERILEVYNEEKLKLKRLKKLPFKILNHVNFFVTMFLIILFFFILDIGIVPTALILFSAFCLTYFTLGLLMHIVFYMIAENKTREKLMKLEEDKNKLLAEEKLKADALLRVKIDKERKRYEQIERLRFQEEERRRIEDEEARIKAELIAKEKAETELRIAEEDRIRAEEELKLKLEEEKLEEELEMEKFRMKNEKRQKLQKLLTQTEESNKPYSLPKLSKAEFAQKLELLRNEWDKNLLNEIEGQLTIPDISGIEEFSDMDRLKEQFGVAAVFPDYDNSDDMINSEIDNTMLQSVKTKKIVNEDDITDFDTADIEEAKQVIFKRARNKIEKESLAEDIELEKQIVKQAVTKQSNNSNGGGKAISGKSFMVIKEMLKDG